MRQSYGTLTQQLTIPILSVFKDSFYTQHPASWISVTFRSPYDCCPVMQKLSLVPLVDRRVEANLLFLWLIDGRIIDVYSLLSQLHCKVPFRFTPSPVYFVVPTAYGCYHLIHKMMHLGNENSHLLSNLT